MSDITYVPTTPDFNADEAKKLLSPLNYQGEEREKQFELLQRLGHFSSTDDGFFGELADRAAGSFVSSMEGVGATLNELGMGSAMQDYFRGVQNVNQHWNAPEDQSIAGYIGGALGSALGSTAAPLAAGVAGSLINPVAGVTAGVAAGFTQSFGNNIQRNREAGYSEDKAYGMAFLESTIDSVIENAPWGIVGKGTKLAANLGRLQKISSAGKKELLNKVGKYMASQVGEKETKSLLKKWGKEAVISGLGEGGEEALQYLNTYVNQKIGGDPNAEFSINDFAEAIGQGIIGGFGIGGAMSVPGIAHDAKMRKANAMPDKSMVENTPAVENENQDIQEQPLFDTLITEVGNALGIKIDFMDNRPDGAELQESKNGFYDPKDKTLYLNRETYSVNPAETLGHELKHYLDDNDPELVRAFDNLIESGKNEAGKQEIAEMMAAFGITEKEGAEEFSSDMFGKLIARPETWQKMATMLDEKTPGMGEKFLQTLRDFYALVKNKLENLVGANPEAEHYLNNVSELQDEAARILAELRRRNGNSNQVENVIGAKGNTSVETVPVSQINVDAQRFQFKSNTNKTSGVDETNKLGGDWDARTAGNLYLWQDKNGKLYVVNGHHRLELAQRNKVENVNAIIDRETDGVTAEQARRNGVLINIRDGQGEVRDYASFVRSENLSEDEAKAQGVTARQKGRSGFLLGKSGDTLYEAYTNEVIPETKAVIIADVAKGNEAIEYAGIKLATDRKLAGEVLRQTLKLAALNSSGTKNNSEQGSLFEMADDSVLQEWEEIGKLAAKHTNEIRTRIDAAKDAIKNPEAAKSLGVKTIKGAEKLLSQAQAELARWENYATDPELMAQLRQEAGIPEREVVSDLENTTQEDVADEGRFNPNSEAPLLSRDEDANDFQLVAETQDDIRKAEKAAEDAELLKQEKIKADAAKNTGDLFAVQPEVVSTENAQTTNDTDFEDRSKEIGLTFDEFYNGFQNSLDAIFAEQRKKFSTLGSEIESECHSAANTALVKAYMTFSPENGASINTYASHLVKNAIVDVLRKHKAETRNMGGRISLDQTNEQGETLYEAVADETPIQDYDTVFARKNPEEAKRRIKALESLTSREKKIIDLLENTEKSLSEIGRSSGVGLTTEQVRETLASIATKVELDAGVRYSRKRETTENKKSSTSARSSTGLSQSFPDYRGLGGNSIKIATAALQFVEHNHNIASESKKVNGYFEKTKKILSDIKNGNPVFVNRFLETLLNMGFVKHGRDSVYFQVDDLSTIRLSNHTANASNFSTIGENASNVSLVLRSAITGDKKFGTDENVNLLELQFGKKFLDKSNLPILLADIAHFMATGEYIDNIGALKFDISGNENFKKKVLDNLYFSAVNRGDMKTAEELVRMAEEKAGYSSDSDYQGSLAFNGAAPSKNEYYESKEDRAEAWSNGDYEGEFSLGDFVDNNIDTHDLGWQLTNPTAIRIADQFGKESIRNLQNAVRNSKRTIKIYRAVDANIKENSVRNGDWVTPSKSYAKQHIELQDWEQGRIIEQEVSIDDIWWNGDDINEWGYDDGQNYTYANTPNNRKLQDVVTYDDDGNIIPLSQRFNRRKDDVRYSRKKFHQQIIPIVRDGKVRDEYADLLERDGYTPEKISQWQDEAMEWIVKQGGIVESAIKMADDTAPTNPAVAEIARRYILNSNVFQDKVEPDTRKRLYKREIDARSAWGREGRAMQLNALNLNDVESVQALLDKLHEDMSSEEVIKLRKQIKEKIGVDIFNLPKNIVDDKPVLDAVLREHLSHKSSFKDKFYEYWINGILSGPGTHAANILGNTANAAYELGVKRLAEAVVNVVSGRKNGASFSEFREMAKAINFKDAAQAAAKAWDLEVLDPDGKFLENNLVAIGGKTGRFIRVPGRALKAADAFAKAIIQPMETAAYAYRMGVADGKSGEELQQFIQKQLTSKDSIAYLWARERARELTFQEDPGHFVKHLMALRESPGVTGTIMRFTLPFIKTPYNILRQGVRKGPLGTLNLINETAQLFSGKRKFDDEYVGHFAEQLLAWGTFMAFYTLSGDDDKLPVITGTSTHYGSAEYGFKANKVPPYSIRLGDTWYSYSRIEPLATGLAAIADGIQALRNLRNGKEATAVMKDVLSGAIKTIGEKSYLDSIGETLKIIEDPERNMMKPATNLFASAVPAFLKQARQAFTEEVGDSKSRELGFDWWREQFFFVTNKAGITTAIPKVDYFGRDVKKDDWSDSMFSDLGRLLPIKRVEADKNMDKVERLIWNYNMRNPNEEYYPGIPRNTFTVNKQKMYLAGQDYHDFAVDAGKLAHKQLNNAVKAGYLNVDKPTEKDIELIKKVFSRARKETRQKYIDKAKKVEK